MEIQKKKYMHEVCAGACVYDDHGNILIVKNKWGNWTLPKGYFEPQDVSPFECAQREVKEETNIEFKLKHKYTTSYQEIRNRQSYEPRGLVLKQVILCVGIATNSNDLKADREETTAVKFVSKREFKLCIEGKETIIALEAIEKLNQSCS